MPIARQLTESDVWEMSGDALKLWIWILMDAVYDPNGVPCCNGRLRVQRGQLWTTIPRIQEALKSVKGRGHLRPETRLIEGYLAKFREHGMIASQVVRRGILITINNYDDYNPKGSKEKVPTNPKSEKSLPQWAHDLVDEWDDGPGLPTLANRGDCVDQIEKLNRLDNYPVPEIQAVVRWVINNDKAPLYIDSPMKFRKRRRSGTEKTYEMYRREMNQKPGAAATEPYQAADTTSWRDDL